MHRQTISYLIQLLLDLTKQHLRGSNPPANSHTTDCSCIPASACD